MHYSLCNKNIKRWSTNISTIIKSMSKYLIFCISLHENEKFPPCVICLVCGHFTGPDEYKLWPNDSMYMINTLHKWFRVFFTIRPLAKLSITFKKRNWICTIQVEFSHICVYRTSVWHLYFCSVFALFCCCFLQTKLKFYSNYPVAPVLMLSAKIWVKNNSSSVTMDECSVCSRKFSTHSRKVNWLVIWTVSHYLGIIRST